MNYHVWTLPKPAFQAWFRKKNDKWLKAIHKALSQWDYLFLLSGRYSFATVPFRFGMADGSGCTLIKLPFRNQGDGQHRPL